MNKYLPKKLYERPKTGFSVPMAEWLRGPLKKWADELLNKNRIEKEGYFNPILVERIWKEHLSKREIGLIFSGRY